MSTLYVELLGKQERILPGSYAVEFDPIVYGGFGYVRSELRGEFSHMPGIYYGEGGINAEVADFDEVFVSIPFPWWTRKIISQAKQYPETQFILMGNGVAMLPRVWSLPPNVSIHREWPEEVFGIQTFRQGSIDLFLPPQIRKMAAVVPIDYACYWKKCSFCCQNTFGGSFARPGRGDLTSILDSVPPGIHVELSSPALSPKRINELCSYMYRKRHRYGALVRADSGVVSAFEKYSDLSGLNIAVGAESFSQELLNSLNKGIKVENIINLVNVLLNRGAGVELFLLGGIPGMTPVHLDEEEKALKKMNCRGVNLEWSLLDLRWDKKPDESNPYSYVPASYGGSGYYRMDPDKKTREMNLQRRRMFREMFASPQYMDKVRYQYAWTRGTPY